MSDKEALSLMDVLGDKDAQKSLMSLVSDEDNTEETQEQEDDEQVESSESDEDDADSQKSEGDESDDAADAEEDTDEADTEAEDLYEVPVDGETVQVTFDELKKGYSRTADYTRKTQKLAEERRQIEAEREAIQAARVSRQRYDGQLEALEGLLKQAQPKEPDPALRRENPAEFAAQEAEFAQHQRRVQVVENERQRVAEEAARERQTAVGQVVRQEQAKLLKAIPEWTDETKRRKEQQELLEYVGQYGYTPDDLNNTVDHRLFVLVRKAMMYDRVVKKTPKPKKGPKSPSLKPGSGAPRQKKTTRDAARQRLVKSGSVADGASVLEGLLDD